MTRRERLMASLEGRTVDRPPVCFYEINGLDEDPADPDPFNIYSDPSWKPLLVLAREKSDRIVMRSIPVAAAPGALDELRTVERWHGEGGGLFERTTIRAGSRNLTTLTRRDRDINTVWTLEHLLKDDEDLEAWLDLPEPSEAGEPIIAEALAAEKAIGETGIIMVDTADPVCIVAQLFSLADFTVLAFSELELFHRALAKASRRLLPRTRAVAALLPGRLWRIYGPEYCTPPYLPPELFREYVTRYDTPMVEAIQAHGGFARIHSHGRIREVLEGLAETGCTGLDPIEPPPQGDVELGWVRRHYGRQMTLFGNVEVADIENLPTDRFAEKVKRALDEGTAPGGRGFVLMPTACPYGRRLKPLTMRNYEKMVELAEAF